MRCAFHFRHPRFHGNDGEECCLLHLLLQLRVDCFNCIVNRTTFDQSWNLRRYSSIGFIGESAVIDPRNLAEPSGEILPCGFAAKERVTGFLSIAVAGRQEGTKRTLAHQDLLVEIGILAPFIGQEINRRSLIFRRGQDIPTGAA